MNRQVVLGAVAIVAFAVAGWFAFGRGGDNVALGQDIKAKGVCLSCKGEDEYQYSIKETPPIKCHKCGQVSAYPWQFCTNCNKRFVPPLEIREPGGPPRIPLYFACPACGGAYATQYIPQMHESKGDLPLPRKP